MNRTPPATSAQRWPDAMAALLAELSARRLRLALVTDGPWFPRCVAQLRGVLEEVNVGASATKATRPPLDLSALIPAGDDPILVTALDVLCWPEAGVDVVGWLCQLALDRPVLATWPGSISGGRLVYSEAGRADHIDRALPDVLVLRPVEGRFDDVPFTIERTR